MSAETGRRKMSSQKDLDDSIPLAGKLSSGCWDSRPLLKWTGVGPLPGRFYALRHFIDPTISPKGASGLLPSPKLFDLFYRMVTFLPQHPKRFRDMGKRIFLAEVHETVPGGHHGLMIVGPDGDFTEEGID